ncbi:unnamed protein product, partial [Callosobruchus maculatus]
MQYYLKTILEIQFMLSLCLQKFLAGLVQQKITLPTTSTYTHLRLAIAEFGKFLTKYSNIDFCAFG